MSHERVHACVTSELLNQAREKAIAFLHCAVRLYEAVTWRVMDVTDEMLFNQNSVGLEREREGGMDREREHDTTAHVLRSLKFSWTKNTEAIKTRVGNTLFYGAIVTRYMYLI